MSNRCGIDGPHVGSDGIAQSIAILKHVEHFLPDEDGRADFVAKTVASANNVYRLADAEARRLGQVQMNLFAQAAFGSDARAIAH